MFLCYILLICLLSGYSPNLFDSSVGSCHSIVLLTGQRVPRNSGVLQRVAGFVAHSLRNNASGILFYLSYLHNIVKTRLFVLNFIVIFKKPQRVTRRARAPRRIRDNLGKLIYTVCRLAGF